MQRSIFFCLLIVLLAIRCSNNGNQTNPASITGTYVRSGSTEFGTIHDTIQLSMQHADANTYSIEQRTLYARRLDGITQEPEYKIIIAHGVYDPETKRLQNQRTLLFYSFDPVKNVLYAGANHYTKLK